MTRRLIVGASAVLLIGLAYLGWDFLRIDGCLDDGGAWDYAASACRGARS